MTLSLRNIIFAFVLVFFLCGPVIMAGSDYFSLGVPRWLSYEEYRYLSGSPKATQGSQYLSFNYFIDRKFQSAIEEDLSQNAPAKAAAVSVNAALQNCLIKASNIFFKFGIAPTFYNSTILDAVNDKRLLGKPYEYTAELETDIQNFRNSLNKVASQNSNIDFYVYPIPISTTVNWAPDLEDLLPDRCKYSDYIEGLSRPDNKFEIIDGTTSYEKFLNGWNRTDLHWKINGAYDAYSKIADILPHIETAKKPTGEVTYEAPYFYGNFVRSGLTFDYHDLMSDYLFDDEDKLSVKINGEQSSLESIVHREKYMRVKDYNVNLCADRYGEYFHSDLPLIEITNNASESDRVLMLVGDSFTNALERMLAFHYSKVLVFDPRHNKDTLEQFLQKNSDINDVIFLFTDTRLVSVTKDMFVSDHA